MHKNLFYNKFIILLYMFRTLCAHHQEVKIVLYSIWYHHTCRWHTEMHGQQNIKKKLTSCRDNYEENTEICWSNVSGGYFSPRSLFYFQKSRRFCSVM